MVWGLRVGEMAGSSKLDLLTAFWTNTLLSVAFLICYAVLKNQPLNLRVYFPRLYVRGEEEGLNEYVACQSGKGKLAQYVNLNWRSYLRGFNWIWLSLKKTEEQLIEDVGLDSTVFLRIFLLGYGSAYSSSLFVVCTQTSFMSLPGGDKRAPITCVKNGSHVSTLASKDVILQKVT